MNWKFLKEPSIRIWPLLIAYLNSVRYIVAWCEVRQDFRHIRTDRVQSLQILDEKYPGRRAILIKEWEVSWNSETK
jgi:predicted DNA-binding transcriptional regulator YafY